MSDPITFRPTREDAANLAILTADGTSPTRAIRHALELAAHQKHQADLRADAARLAANPDYQAEIRAVGDELAGLGAWSRPTVRFALNWTWSSRAEAGRGGGCVGR